MELIYIYIDKYRTFEKQEISFSNKFNVNYDSENKVLSIEENKDYVDIYPDNIVNINGILGKNASGKSSLISLIGDRIEKRNLDRDLIFGEEEDPHRKIPFYESTPMLSAIRYTNHYFILYYLGKSKIGNNLFAFETNFPTGYMPIFQYSNEKVQMQKDEDYYLRHGWFAAVFERENINNILIDTTNMYPCSENNIECETSIISFQNNQYTNKFDILDKMKEEYIIGFKRILVPMQSVFFKSQIKFLFKQMNLASDKRLMYKDKKYVLNIRFYSQLSLELSRNSDHKISINSFLEDYRNYDLGNYKEWQKIVLAFLYQYTWYLATSVSKSYSLIGDLEALSDMRAKTNIKNYLDIKNMYYNQISHLLKYFNNTYLTISEFQKCENALEVFLKDAEQNKVGYSYKKNNLIVEFTRDSNIGAFDDFFDYFIDENIVNSINYYDSITNNFLDVDIQWMCAGEKENLALFTSIDEQISFFADKKEYILLFDEIERSMHPDLCRNLVSNLVNFLKQYPDKKFQIIIASHSPFIASDLLQENIVCLSREDDKSFVSNMTEKPFAQNIHTILKSQFFLDYFIGEYATKCINCIIKCLNYENIDKVKNELNKFLCSNNESEQKLIESDEKAKNFIEYVIDSIGEHIIRNELHRRLSNAKWLSTKEKIQYYKNKIKELEDTSID